MGQQISFLDSSSKYSDSDNDLEIPCLETSFPFSDRTLNPSGRLYANSLSEEKQINFQDFTSPGLVDLTTDELDLNDYDGSSIYTQGTFTKQQTSDVLFGQLQPQKENNNAVPHQLIGSTSDRNALSSEIDRAFTESLYSDLRKEMELRYTDSVNTKAVDLQSSQIARVVPEQV